NKGGRKRCYNNPNSTTFSTSAPTAYTLQTANPFSYFPEKGKMADSMCDGLLSPTSITLSIWKNCRATVRAPCRLAIDNEEEPAIVEGVDGPKVVTPHMSSW